MTTNSPVITTFVEGRVTVLVGDISRQRVDAIVNAANSTLMGGGGVDGAIHRAGGPQILDECKEIRRIEYPGGLPTGHVVITSGGMLAAKYVIHTVGPIFGRSGDRDSQLLSACYRKSLELAAERQLRTIAFPSISTGAFGYPREDAAAVSSEAISTFLANDEVIEEVRLVFYSQADANIFLKHQNFSIRD